MDEAGFCQRKHFYIIKYNSDSEGSWEEHSFRYTTTLLNGFFSNRKPYFETSYKTAHLVAKPKSAHVIRDILAKPHTLKLVYWGLETEAQYFS